jgi:hypothetical protein
VHRWIVASSPCSAAQMALVVLHASAAGRLPCLASIALLPTLAASRASLALLRHVAYNPSSPSFGWLRRPMARTVVQITSCREGLPETDSGTITCMDPYTSRQRRCPNLTVYAQVKRRARLPSRLRKGMSALYEADIHVQLRYRLRVRPHSRSLVSVRKTELPPRLYQRRVNGVRRRK